MEFITEKREKISSETVEEEIKVTYTSLVALKNE